MRIVTILTLAGALALAACGRNEPEEQPVANDIVELPEETMTVNEALPAPANAANATAPAAPAPEFTDEEQMRDDADATGLTARLPQDDAELPGQTANETRPAE